MSIAQSLPEVHPDFVQRCPLCYRSNRIVVQGVYVVGNKADRHPDMGYSFCNCRDIFYTDKRNVTHPIKDWIGDGGIITQPDPYFAWPNPYEFLGWNVRSYEILWDMEEYVNHLESIGFKVESYWRDMDPASTTPQTFHIKVKLNAKCS